MSSWQSAQKGYLREITLELQHTMIRGREVTVVFDGFIILVLSDA